MYKYAVSVWPDGKNIFQYLCRLKECKFAEKHKIFAKIGSKFWQIKLIKVAQILLNFAKVAKFRHTALDKSNVSISSNESALTPAYF